MTSFGGRSPYWSFGDTITVPTMARVHFLSPKLWYEYYHLQLPCYFASYFLVFTYHNF
jgi:hypothetical protein